MSDQLILEFPSHKAYKKEDFYVSPSNQQAYVFTLMDYQDGKLDIYLKANFNNNIMSKNISHEVKNIKDELVLNSILKDLKLRITDLWKEENLVNLLMPLSIKIKFQHSNLKDLDVLRKVLYKINIIYNYTLEEFNVNNSFFKIYYYGDPKKLSMELKEFGYHLKNDQDMWRIYKYE